MNGARGHLLIVDDDPDIRHELREAFEAEGFAVDVASNGLEALETLESSRPKVVLLDLHMPVLDGWRVLDLMTERRIDVPVLVMTAGRHGVPARPVPTFVKPLRVPDLIRAVERYGKAA